MSCWSKVDRQQISGDNSIARKPFSKAKIRKPATAQRLIGKARAMARWSVWSYLPGLPPDKTNLSSVHVNTGTHRGTLQVYNRRGCIHIFVCTFACSFTQTSVTHENTSTNNRFIRNKNIKKKQWAMADCGVASRRLCLGQKVALEHTAKTN